MKRTTHIVFISIVVTMLMASCVGHFPRFYQSGRYILQRLPDGAELYVREGIDAIEITLIGEGLKIEDLSPLQGVLMITRSNHSDLTVTISGFRNVDFSRPVLRISSEHAAGMAISKCDTIVLNRISNSYWRQNSADPELIGDYNGDGYITLSDFASFAPAYGFSEGSQEYDEKFDVGASEKQYSGIWQKIFSVPGAPDGSITLADFAVFANNYGFANPYLGTWNFTGTIDYESSTYGYVKATGTGTLEINQQNWEMSGPVEITASSTYTDEDGNLKSEEFSIEIDSVDIVFTSTEMTITGSMANPVNGTKYDILMKGKLRVEGDAIFAESSGTGEGYGIFLINPVRKIGEWTAHK